MSDIDLDPDYDLFARAALVRRAIKDGELDPYIGLYYVIFPPERLLELERALPQRLRRSRRYNALERSA